MESACIRYKLISGDTDGGCSLHKLMIYLYGKRSWGFAYLGAAASTQLTRFLEPKGLRFAGPADPMLCNLYSLVFTVGRQDIACRPSARPGTASKRKQLTIEVTRSSQENSEATKIVANFMIRLAIWIHLDHFGPTDVCGYNDCCQAERRGGVWTNL